MANLLADGLNLGLTRMAEACSIASLSQLAWSVGCAGKRSPRQLGQDKS
jgi:hypothetical protein